MSEQATKGLSAGTLAAIRARWKQVVYLIEIGTSPVLRYTSARRPIASGGDVYYPRGLGVGELTWGAMTSAGVKVVIDNRDSALTDVMYAQGLTGKVLTLTILMRQSDSEVWADPYEAFAGPISDAMGSAATVALELTGSGGLRRRGGPRVLDSYCRHPYKGARCQYAGAQATCDRTFATCSARSNGVHFGGVRWAPPPGSQILLGPSAASVGGTSSSSQWKPVPPFVDLYPEAPYPRPRIDSPPPEEVS